MLLQKSNSRVLRPEAVPPFAARSYATKDSTTLSPLRRPWVLQSDKRDRRQYDANSRPCCV